MVQLSIAPARTSHFRASISHFRRRFPFRARPGKNADMLRERRRIDWPMIVGPDAVTAVWKRAPARSEVVALLRELAPLFRARHPDDLAKRAVELALGPVGLVRAGVYFYDDRLDLMLGTWGTDLRRKVVDEHSAMFRLDEGGRRAAALAASGEALWTVVEDCPIIEIGPKTTRVVGRGWSVCTPICSPRGLLGALYNDAGLTRARVDAHKQENAALLCAMLGMLLTEMPRSRGKSFVSGLAAPHPAVTKATRILSDDPTLSASELAANLLVSPSRFARVFKGEMGVSLVRYRNQLRLERFVKIMDGGGSSMLEAALEAGFGSYAQFHRVFQALRGTTPRAYLGRAARGGGEKMRKRRK
jgi:AraC-like DNA-binding protein